MNEILRFIKQATLYPFRYILGRRKARIAIDDIKNNSGGVIDLNGKKVAVYKDSTGQVSSYSAVCTHLGCVIGWDEANKRWQCPCHGSRYDTQGRVLKGPTKRNLPQIEIS